MSLIAITEIQTILVPIRLPLVAKGEIAALRKLAIKHHINFTASLSSRIEDVLKDIRSELEALDHKPTSHANGAAAREG